MIFPLTLVGLVPILASAKDVAPQGRACLVSDERPAQPPVSRVLRKSQDLPSTITVDVHFHISSTKEHEDLITDTIVNAQWNVLHRSFAKYDINLVLNSTERVVDDIIGKSFLVYEGPDKGWVKYTDEENNFYKSTRRGGYDALNLYFFSDYSPGATGYCSWPTVIAEDDDLKFAQDSCQVSGLTMPGITPEQGAFEDWNLGHLAVHEAGHWFGLNHTFSGGCSEPGDFVDDTPSQLTQIFGCPIGSDSCPDKPGLDPIHNFMGYTQDNCTNSFTAGQKRRMFETFFGFRRKV
ncbi:uncharacterized protein QYS62_010678 [Fusarium acuminatum]|uniref:Peptidase M43 pregnancy-associated plasma-A domain-containing protein n=1 Tax=Fusarium acuminatum TaxID=5515 RepID=A0ABZ2XBU0_9HYPO